MIVLALLPVAIWTYLLVGRSQFWAVSKHLAPLDLPLVRRKVAVVIPARDEAGSIAETVEALRRQTLPPSVLIVVNDHSADATAELARSAGAQVINAEPLAAGWSGKLWALSQGLGFAETAAPDYFLFTDADIVHDPQSLARLVSIAESGSYDLVSFMVKLQCETLAERALIPAFVFFFFLLYPPGRVPGAAGGCILIKPETLERMGGFAAIRSEVIDDCALARAVARQGGKIWLGLTDDLYSTRSYGTFGEIGHMISRTAFNQLHHSTLLLLGTLVGLFVTYLLPVLLLFSGKWLYAILGGLAWLLMASAYGPMVRFYKISWLWSFAMPAIASFYSGATVHSAIRYWRGVGGSWKGRFQDGRIA